MSNFRLCCSTTHQHFCLAMLVTWTLAVVLLLPTPLSSHAILGGNRTQHDMSGTLDFTPPEYAPVICIQFAGRLGNEMFAAAGALGLALTLGRRPILLKPKHLPHALKDVRFVAGPADTERCRRAERFATGGLYRWTPETMRNVRQPRDFTVDSHLASFLYFDRHKVEILKFFTMKDSIRREAARVINHIRRQHKGHVTVVGMHMRRGDLVPLHMQVKGYMPADGSYARQAMAFYRARHPRAVFLIASDNIEYFRARFQHDASVYYLRGTEAATSPPTNLWTVAACDHVAISFGTFSWWIGYFNAARGGTVVFMKDFITEGTGVGDSFDPIGETFYPPSWIPL